MINGENEKTLERKFLLDCLKEHNYKNIDFSKNEDYTEFFIKEIEKLNDVKFTPKQEEKFLKKLSDPKLSSFEFAEWIWGVNKIPLSKSEKSNVNFRPKFIDWENIEKNNITICQQPRMFEDGREYKPDVMILINGMPFIVIELKNQYKNIEVAVNDLIDSYREKVFAKEIFRFIQILVGSNGSEVKILPNNRGQKSVFAFKWENEEGESDLKAFAKDFLKKENLINFLKTSILLKKQSLSSEKQVIILRPYQSAAVQKVLNFVDNKVKENKLDASYNQNNAYVWHTTGSGKTITSFKIAQNLTQNENIDKVIFLIDRNDLSEQTKDEFSKMAKSDFSEESAAQGVKHLEELLKKEKFIITTIQKMNVFLTKISNENKEEVQKYKEKKFVFIIDECHRSQTGSMHNRITRTLSNSILIGFTGTPIFKTDEENDKTTESIFGKRLHTYNILNAINDKNVLDFSTDIYPKNDNDRKYNKDQIVDVIKKKHSQYTYGKKFNAIFALDNQEELLEFYKLLSNEPDKIFVTAIFSDNNNSKNLSEENKEKLKKLNEGKELILKNYNKQMGRSFSLNTWKNFIRDVQSRFKKEHWKIDILLVVNMLLTGYDSKYINTLYIKKSLKRHSLLQAFSRTNRIHSNEKRFGKIVNFSLSQDIINESIKIYSDKDIEEIKDIFYGKQYSEAIKDVNKIWKEAIDSYNESNINLINSEQDYQEYIKNNPNKVKEFLKIIRKFVEAYNDLKTFGEYEQKDIKDFDPEKLNQKLILVKNFEEAWKSNKIKKDYYNEDEIFSSYDFDIENFREVKIDFKYITDLLGLAPLQESLDDKEWEIQDLIKKIEEIKKDSLDKLEKTKKSQTMSDEEFKDQKQLIYSWFDEFIKQIKKDEKIRIWYTKDHFKTLKNKVLNNLLNNTRIYGIEKIAKKYSEVDEDEMKKDFEERKKTQIFDFGGINRPKFMKDYFSKVMFNKIKINSLKDDYKNLLKYYVNLEQIVDSLITR